MPCEGLCMFMPWLLSVSEDVLCHVRTLYCMFMPWLLSVSEDVLCHVKDSVGSCPGSCLS